ncbi:MAG: hypothetical protein PHU44_11785 [Syntrophales bacterium]|nr:hypothetical protein [Syntrophales bacterium]MDD5641754.1 hypothetical protein [Syntrophales bacterium]
MLRLLLATLVLLSLSLGCAAGSGTYQSQEEYTPYITDVDPSFYDYDPTLRDWYTAPYWDPSRY